MSKQHTKQHTKRRAKRRAKRPRRTACIPGYACEGDVANELGVSKRTLRKWRKAGEGPPYVKFARQFHYPDAARATWLRAKEITPVRTEVRAA